MNEKPLNDENNPSQNMLLTRVQYNLLWDRTRNYSFEDLQKKRLLKLNSAENKNKLKSYFKMGGNFSLFCDSTSSKTMENMTDAFCYSIRNYLNFQDSPKNYYTIIRFIYEYNKLFGFNVSKDIFFKNSRQHNIKNNKFVCSECHKYRKNYFCKELNKNIVQFPFWYVKKKYAYFQHLICIERSKQKKIQKEVGNFMLIKSVILNKKYPQMSSISDK
jgi:hypothetical protein